MNESAPKIDRAEEDTVAYVVKDGIAWVRFNRPEKRNCMSPKLNRQMMRVLDELEFRADVGVLPGSQLRVSLTVDPVRLAMRLQ